MELVRLPKSWVFKLILRIDCDKFELKKNLFWNLFLRGCRGLTIPHAGLMVTFFLNIKSAHFLTCFDCKQFVLHKNFNFGIRTLGEEKLSVFTFPQAGYCIFHMSVKSI